MTDSCDPIAPEDRADAERAYLQAQNLVVDCMRWRPRIHRHRDEILTRLDFWEPYELYVLANLAANAANAAGFCPVDVACTPGEDGATIAMSAVAILMLGGACDTAAAGTLGVRLKALWPHDLMWILVATCDAFAAQGMDAGAVSALKPDLIPRMVVTHLG
jgi:hypothetical protein